MSSEDSIAAAAASATRVPVACLPCRARHVRCDAQQPICLRCSLEGRTCEYVKSRRGGLNRARLAERRQARDRAAAEFPANPSPAPMPRREVEQETPVPAVSGIAPGGAPGLLLTNIVLPAESGGINTEEASIPDLPADILVSSVAEDPLVRLFYKNFHRCHPCALPQRKLHQFYGDTTPWQESIRLLLAVMRFIGSMYNHPDSRTRYTPQLLEVEATDRFEAVKKLPPDPFLVQSHLLYCIASYWNANKVKAQRALDAAIGIALDLGMNSRHFAAQYARNDAVLQECLRRTWWQLYCVDAYFAAINSAPSFPLGEVETETELPCEDEEYESGVIPTPKTLDDFDLREFASENQVFSSFAYLIGATRSIALALSAMSPDSSNWLSPKTIAEIDAIIDSWFLLLPVCKKEVFKEGSVVDELMFQAHMAVHANLIALHRPLSKLSYHPFEGTVSCFVRPPEQQSARDSETMHTQRCLQSIEAQLRFLVLPVPPFRRSPFTICMTASGTNSLLAAIKLLFSGRQLAVARHQLRLVVGYIKALANVWPQGLHNLDEITRIAREVLSKRNEQQPQGITEGGNAANRQALMTDIDATTMMEGLDDWSSLKMVTEAQDGVGPSWNYGNEFHPDIPILFGLY
ncbi:hypothetical protein GGR50DRAFT_687008 [Xylaria sp. CBS 124048]|nr:hypothetical protein GGR50DRAFT_687008 [Xylaria sp. CBS 124048]